MTSEQTWYNSSRPPSSSSTTWLGVLAITACALSCMQFLVWIQVDGAAPILSSARKEFVAVPPHKQHVPLPSAESLGNNSTKISSAANIQPTTPEPEYYMVFSTSCSPQQHWESLVFFYHAHKVGQPGSVTRIVSGCTDQEAKDLQDFHVRYIQSMSKQFHLHLTPSYSKVHHNRSSIGTGRRRLVPYKYMNKPYGLRHWLENALGCGGTQVSKADDAIVMLLDPDMILLRPLVHDFSNEDVLWVEDQPATKVVRHGFPISQQDGELADTTLHVFLPWLMVMLLICSLPFLVV